MIQFPIISDPRGNLTFIESENHIPFSIQRVFWIYDVPGGETRGGHAYRKNEEIIIALSGSFDVVTSENGEKTRHTLNRSYSGLYIRPMIWRHLENFSTNALALIISSNFFSEKEYIRDENLITKEEKFEGKIWSFFEVQKKADNFPAFLYIAIQNIQKPRHTIDV